VLNAAEFANFISYISQSAATELRCGGQCGIKLLQISWRIQQWKGFRKLANICQSYERMYSGTVFLLTVYTRNGL